jgi:starch-binding outer membrane protein, SusD/RagB family
MKTLKISIIMLGAIALTFSSCLKDLNQKPISDITSAAIYEDFANYKGVLAKCYAGLATTGNQAPAGKPDIEDIDEGYSSYIRILWTMQELGTDEVKCAWGDKGLPPVQINQVGSDNSFNQAMYYRLFYQISLCNEFLRELTDAKLANRNITGANLASAIEYRNEARFLRALAYYHALDLYGGNVPFTTETSSLAELPAQTTASALYAFVESELKGAEAGLKAPKTNDYGRADKAAAWMLLSRLYLNAKTYIGAANYAGAAEYAQKVIGSSAYSLDSNYADVFCADNHTSNEIIMSVNFDGIQTRTYGGTTFLTHANVGGKMNPADFGIGGGWEGMRTTKEFAAKLDVPADTRNRLFKDGQTLEINDILGKYTSGWGLAKFSNLRKDGTPGKDPLFVDTDYPMFRLAEAYMNYVEANVIGGAGNASDALTYINIIRNRAYAFDPIGNYGSISDVTADVILEERGREFYHECFRRTDLRRFDKYTGGAYNWSWKGGTQVGGSLPDFKAIYPIPASDLNANYKLKQNLGY